MGGRSQRAVRVRRARAAADAAGGRLAGPPAVGNLARLLVYGLVGAIVAFTLISAGLALFRDDPAAELAATQAYLDEFKVLTEEAGFVTEQGLKAGVADIGNSRYDDETLRGMPEAWGGMLGEVKARMADVEPPRALREAHERFLEAMDGYVEVARLLRLAVDEPRDRRLEAAQAAGDLGAATDQIWNAGAVMVQDHLRAHGAEPVYWLPDPEHDGRTP